MNETYTLQPIGRIQASDGRFILQLEPDCAPALAELDGFSHINILWWAHLFDDPDYRALRLSESPYKDAPPQMGIFATRSPIRPNLIMHTVAAVLHIDPLLGQVHIAYIDAEDGTPLLDIKPYQPCTDRVRDVAVPDWCAAWPSWLEESGAFDWTAVFDNAR